MKNVSMMFVALTLILTSLISPAYAFETSYFQRFRGQEIHVTYLLNDFKKKSVWLVVKRIDHNNNILEGKSNHGREFIEIKSIVAVRQSNDTTHHVLNPHRDF